MAGARIARAGARPRSAARVIRALAALRRRAMSSSSLQTDVERLVVRALAAAFYLALHLLFRLRLARGLFFFRGRRRFELVARKPRPIDQVLLLELVHGVRDGV